MQHVLTTLPLNLREVLANAGLPDIDDWWRSLGEAVRADVLHLWQDCSPDGLLGGVSDRVQVSVEVEFVDDISGEPVDGVWHPDLYEWIVGHELCYIQKRTMHICSRHPVARATVHDGIIPAGYICPLADANCPMHKILTLVPGKHARLRIRFREAKETASNQQQNFTAVCRPPLRGYAQIIPVQSVERGVRNFSKYRQLSRLREIVSFWDNFRARIFDHGSFCQDGRNYFDIV